MKARITGESAIFSNVVTTNQFNSLEKIYKYIGTSRKNPCLCGSVKKYKHCCGKIKEEGSKTQ